MVDFTGGAGDDVFTGGADNDILIGNGGNDTLSGNGGQDILAGGDGGDTLDGGDGDDMLYSGTRSPPFSLPYYNTAYTPPVLDTGAEVDTLRGGDGSDRLFAGYGDNVDGGAGGSYGDYIYISFLGATSGVTVDFRLVSQTFGGGTITGIENISWVQGSNFDDDINVSSHSQSGYSDFTAVFGMGGNDKLTAGYYTGLLDGGDGNDIVDGRGSQYLNAVSGGAGDDTLYAGTGLGAVARGGDGNDTIYTGGEAHGGAGDDTIVLLWTYYKGGVNGDAGDDTITASDVGHWIAGGAGADVLTGGAGNDMLSSADFAPGGYYVYWQPGDDMGLERDRVSGGGGNDILSIGYGDDADGGDGSDTLRLSLGGATSGVTLDTAGIASGQSTVVAGGTIQNIETLAFLRGTAFADLLTIATQASLLTIEAGDGDDEIRSNGSSVAVLGGNGNDRFVSGIAGDSFDGGAGSDTVDYSNASAGFTLTLLPEGQTVSGPGGDTLISVENVVGSAHADTLTGNSASNRLDGGNGGDTLNGAAGNDTLNGGDGDDRLVGGAGDDSYDGGLGTDTVDVSGEAGPVGVNLHASLFVFPAGHPFATRSLSPGEALDGSGNYESLAGIENLILTGGNDTALGSDEANRIEAGAGDDRITGMGGNDVVIAGAGSDNVVGGEGDDTIEGNDGDDFLFGDAGNDTIDGGGGNDLVQGGTGNDTLRGGTGQDLLRGEDGDDVMYGNDGNDLLRGGAGVDTFDGGLDDGAEGPVGPWGDRISFFEIRATQGVHADLRTGIISNDGFGNAETMTGIESLGADTAFADTFHGNDQRNLVIAGRGDTIFTYGSDDRIELGLAASHVNGGLGSDVLALRSDGGFLLPDSNGDGAAEVSGAAPTGWTVDISAGEMRDGFGNIGTLGGIEHVEGSDADDRLTGGGLTNILSGGAGNDVLNGGGGSDRTEGGLGNDLHYVDHVGDIVVELANEGVDTVATVISYILADHVEHLQANDISGAEALHLTGNALANTIYATQGDNILNGAGGADFMIGYAGNDLYYVDHVGDVAYEMAGGGVDTVIASISFAIGANIESLQANDIGGSAPLTLTGNELSNQIYATQGNNVLNGGGGADFMVGYAGHDLYYVDDLGDLAFEMENGGNDVVVTTISFTLGAHVENLQANDIVGTQALVLTGNALANTIYGTNGNNVLNGAGGADFMAGYGGHDLYYVDNANDVAYEDVNGGNDIVVTTVSYGLGGNVENLQANDIGGTAALTLVGNDLANTIWGTQGDNALYGRGGNDRIYGYGGADRFVFDSAAGDANFDWLDDFQAGVDKIVLDNAIFAGLADGALPANAFVTGGAAADADDRILFNPANGGVFYDADGSGAGAALLIAIVPIGQALTATDFLVI